LQNKKIKDQILDYLVYFFLIIIII
jgi:hypothetical protein